MRIVGTGRQALLLKLIDAHPTPCTCASSASIRTYIVYISVQLMYEFDWKCTYMYIGFQGIINVEKDDSDFSDSVSIF